MDSKQFHVLIYDCFFNGKKYSSSREMASKVLLRLFSVNKNHQILVFLNVVKREQ